MNDICTHCNNISSLPNLDTCGHPSCFTAHYSIEQLPYSDQLVIVELLCTDCNAETYYDEEWWESLDYTQPKPFTHATDFLR